MARKGLLIAVEGINGAGKSTMIQHMCKRVEEIGLQCRVYKFPNRSGYLGDKIDRYLKGDNTVFKTKYDMFDAFSKNKMASSNDILSDLSNGYIVFCDRYIISGVAYHVPIDAPVHVVNAFYNVLSYFDSNLPVPDLCILIIGEYLKSRNEAAERFHDYNNQKMHDIFHSLLSIDQVVNGVNYKIITNRFGLHKEVARDSINLIIGTNMR